MNVDLDESVCRVQEPCRYLKGRDRYRGTNVKFCGNFACPGESTVDGRISKILGINVDLDETVCRVQEPCGYLKWRGP